MDTSAIESYSVWARNALIDAVRNRAWEHALVPEHFEPADAVAVDGRVLTDDEKAKRRDLLEQIERQGVDAFLERVAYTWFNRFTAIRYMEVNGFLPSRTRIFSDESGEARSQALKEAADLDLPGLERSRVLELKQANDDEALFAEVLLAQCAQLADAMPGLFASEGDAISLLLPANLTAAGSVTFRLVTDIPEDAWSDVEILGWMYQFYNSQRKREYYDAKRKASAEDLAPATQLFTPDWIVRYMVENSLGRLWMLNHPESMLTESMEYYIAPEGEAGEFVRVDSPEDIAFCDPACGSGHILVYAFQLLVEMYHEAGYADSDIAQLILEKNLSGMEIDPRAAEIAQVALTMKARELDRRFFRRGIVPNITALQPVAFDEGELNADGQLAQRADLLDALEHLGECGSLLAPSEDDITAIEAEHASVGDDLFAQGTREKLQAALGCCKALARRFTCVVANPPYMGSSSFNPWMSKWVKKNYPDVKSDLCTCFIERGFSLAESDGLMAMVTMQSWMFLGSFEKMRNKLITEKTIESMCHIGARGFDSIGGEVVSTTAFVLSNAKTGEKGAYLRLVDLNGERAKRDAVLEAIANPDCGWFYRADADSFKDIPGTPIAYWASKAMHRAFKEGVSLARIAKPRVGLQTGDNAQYLRFWFEISSVRTNFHCADFADSCSANERWYPHNKGGSFRRWGAEKNYVVDYQCNGKALRCNDGSSVIPDDIAFLPSLTYSRISSGVVSFRVQQSGAIFDSAAVNMYPPKASFYSLLGLLNSSVVIASMSFLTPTLNAQPGDVAKLPILENALNVLRVPEIVSEAINGSESDIDQFETSWDFKRHPLL